MKPRNALITGASRGIGKAIVSQLISDGFRILSPTRGEMDLNSNKSIDDYLTTLREPIDILINNAGINTIASFSDLKDGDLEQTLQVNLYAPMRITRFVVREMMKNKYGRIVNISSIWSVVSKPGRITYTISKNALDGFTRSLAVELAPYNILINSIAPGFVNTELTKKNNSPQEIFEISKKIPLGRLAEPEEIAKMVSFLCSEENSYLTGQRLVIDGGYTCL